MLSTSRIILYIIVMASVTYLVRMLPLVIFRKKIESQFVKSFLYYVPYAVLGAMTFPAVLYATSSVWSAACGLLVAIIMSLKGKGLLTVAVAGCITVYIVELIMRLV